MSVMQFFLSKLHTKNYRFHALRIFEIQKNFWDNVSCGNPFLQKQTLADMLCRIPAQSSFVENFQERLQVHLKRTPLQMFPKVSEKLEKPTKKLKQYTKIQVYSINFFLCRWQDFQMVVPFFYLMKSCYSKRYIKIHGP